MRSFSGASLAVTTMVALSVLPGCTKVGQLKALKDLKAANAAYRQQDYKTASDLYEATVQADPNQAVAFFYLGNSYDQQFKPSKKGEPANDALLAKAAQNYQTAAEKLAASEKPDDKKLGKLSLEYLVAVYGSDKLNDPAKAEPVVQHMIQLDPGETANYFALAKIYEDAGAYDNAEQMLLKAKEVKPNDADVYGQLAGYYNRQAEFEKTIEALEQGAARQPNNPELFYKVATFYWDEVYHDARLKEPQKRELIQKGREAIDHAIKIKPDYAEALVYKGLLLRTQAALEKDPKTQQQLMKEAIELQGKAEELRKKKTAGVGGLPD
jgi:Tfp pilus assembly protein PilF